MFPLTCNVELSPSNQLANMYLKKLKKIKQKKVPQWNF